MSFFREGKKSNYVQLVSYANTDINWHEINAVESIFVLEYCKFHSICLNHDKLEILIPDLIFWKNILQQFADKYHSDQNHENRCILQNLLETTMYLDITEEIGKREIADFLMAEFLTWEKLEVQVFLDISKIALQILKTVGRSQDFLKLKLLTRMIISNLTKQSNAEMAFESIWQLISYSLEIEETSLSVYEQIIPLPHRDSLEINVLKSKCEALIGLSHKDVGLAYFDKIAGSNLDEESPESHERALKLEVDSSLISFYSIGF